MFYVICKKNYNFHLCCVLYLSHMPSIKKKKLRNCGIESALENTKMSTFRENGIPFSGLSTHSLFTIQTEHNVFSYRVIVLRSVIKNYGE
jgi:hypothetical protein